MPRWKLLLSLAVLAPLVAYVAGTLAGGSDHPAPPTPVILEQSSSDSETERGSETRGGQTRGGETRGGQTRGGDTGRGDREDGDDEGRDDEGRDDEGDGPVVVTPRPTELDDDETAGDDDDRDDTGDGDTRDDGGTDTDAD